MTSAVVAGRPGRDLARVRAFLVYGADRLYRVVSRRPDGSTPQNGAGPESARGSVDIRTIRKAWRLASIQPRLHTSASGDFALMSRSDWFTTSGYPELGTYAMHVDSLHLYRAHVSGIRERILPFPIYHIEHGAGGSEGTGDGALAATLAAADAGNDMPRITDAELWETVATMCLDQEPLPLSQPHWGLGDERLRETSPTLDVAHVPR